MTDSPTTHPPGSPADVQGLTTVANCISGRRTVVLFEDRPVDEALVEEAVRLASWAPNHHLTEPWHFYALGPAVREQLIELIRLNAQVRGEKIALSKARRAEAVPGWLVVTCDRADNELTAREDYAATACAIQNLSLYFWQAGIGMKWSTGAVTRDPRFYAALDIDADRQTIAGLISFGYPRHVPPPRPRRDGAALLTRTA